VEKQSTPGRAELPGAFQVHIDFSGKSISTLIDSRSISQGEVVSTTEAKSLVMVVPGIDPFEIIRIQKGEREFVLTLFNSMSCGGMPVTGYVIAPKGSNKTYCCEKVISSVVP
jgi:hypothetical protein